jgi:hypothetical protein
MPARRALVLAPLAAFCVAAAALACGPTMPPSELPPAPSAPPVATVAAPDPDVVRCGVDDQPRPVTEQDLAPSLLPDRAPSRDRIPTQERGLLGIQVEMLPEPSSTPALPGPPPLLISIEPGTPRLGTEPSPGSTGLVGPASGEVCESLAAVADSGPLDREVELASPAAPLRVRSNRPNPSPFVRCLMERACRVKAGSEAASRRLTLPVALKVEAPPPPPPPSSAPVSRIEVQLAKNQGKGGFSLSTAQLSRLVTSASQQCAGLIAPTEGSFVMRIELRAPDALPRRPFAGALLGPRASPVPPPRMFLVERIVAEKFDERLGGLISCMTGQLSSRSVVQQDRSKTRATVLFDVKVSLP